MYRVSQGRMLTQGTCCSTTHSADSCLFSFFLLTYSSPVATPAITVFQPPPNLAMGLEAPFPSSYQPCHKSPRAAMSLPLAALQVQPPGMGPQLCCPTAGTEVRTGPLVSPHSCWHAAPPLPCQRAADKWGRTPRHQRTRKARLWWGLLHTGRRVWGADPAESSLWKRKVMWLSQACWF